MRTRLLPLGLIASATPTPTPLIAGSSAPGSAIIVAAPLTVSAFVNEFHDTAPGDEETHVGRLCTHKSLTLAANALPAASWIPDPAAVTVSAYAPETLVSELRFGTVKLLLPPVGACEAVSRFPPESRVSERSARSKPMTCSLKLTATEATPVDRGSGETLTTSAVGAAVSIVRLREGESGDSLLPFSVCRAVIARSGGESGMSTVPSVVMVVVVPDATALPSSVPL